MAKEQKQDIVVGLDLGTTKVCTIIGEQDDEGQVHIIGVGTTPSTGLKKGSVVNIEQTIASIRKSVQDAERMAGVEVSSAFAGVAGGHIKGLNSRGVIAVSRKDKEITEEDRERVIEAAQAIAIPLDREIIHVIPQEYIVDDQDGIKNPVGMSGVRLEAEVHVVTGAVTSVQNIVRSVERADIQVADIILQPLASAEAILSADEKELGVVLVDIGGRNHRYRGLHQWLPLAHRHHHSGGHPGDQRCGGGASYSQHRGGGHQDTVWLRLYGHR